ncbi:MAG: bifunctional phosphoribosylaminoimidazolecarboxamide formyltransferase/IMP cyclohydrolase [Candidatus Acidiferrales bacterium]
MNRCERALVSVYDKRGVVELARALVELRIEIISTGGTARLLRENQIPLREVSELTGFPEMLGGRVKTLHPAIHAGLLARRDDPKHQQELQRQGLAPIDLVVVNLYPFAQTAARAESTPEEIIEEIDVGGPSMIRAGAKNCSAVGVVVLPDDYAGVIEELRARGSLSPASRLALARKAFAATAAYDATIAGTLEELQIEDDKLVRLPMLRDASGFPSKLALVASKAADLRYGENPHQRAALYRTLAELGIAEARQLQGKELSYNNLLDLDAAWELASEFEDPVAVIIKHTNPCGVALASPEASGQAEAYEKAYACDPVSAFGSVLAFNRPLAAATAEAMSKHFVEAIAAPAYEPAALEILVKKKNLRLLTVEARGDSAVTLHDMQLRSISGGLLVQDRDVSKFDPAQLRTATKRAPTAAEMESLLFAWLVAKHVKSNAIVYARDGQTVGIGAGQMSRVDSVKLGAQKAVLPLAGSVLASDAFFPFPDGIEEAAKVGVTAVIQPGGSVRDGEVIAAADRLGLAMVFTGIRHFRH